MNKQFIKKVSLLTLVVSLSGCSWFGDAVPDNTQEYKDAQVMKPLDLPPDLQTNRINDSFAQAQDSSATYSEFEEEANNPLAAKYNISLSQKPTLIGEGEARYLLAPGDRALTWQRIEAFWATRQLNVKRADTRLGLMDTTADADGYQYRIRMEKGETSRQSEIYLRGVDKTNRIAQKDEAMLRQLADYLGRLYQEDLAKIKQAVPTSAAALPASVLVEMQEDASGQTSLYVGQDFANVWSSVGTALDSKGFNVEDRDRSQGYYFIKYIDPYVQAQQDEGSWYDSILFWRDDADVNPDEYYYIKLNSDAATTRVMILDADEERTSSDTAKRLLRLIEDELTSYQSGARRGPPPGGTGSPPPRR